MYNTKLFFLFALILFLSIGCKESATGVSISTPNNNTLNNPDLGEGRPLTDYWYHFDDEKVTKLRDFKELKSKVQGECISLNISSRYLFIKINNIRISYNIV